MDNNFSESKRNLSRAPQETELGSVPVNQWPSPYKKQVRNLEFQLTSVSRGRVRPPLPRRLSLVPRLNNSTFLSGGSKVIRGAEGGRAWERGYLGSLCRFERSITPALFLFNVQLWRKLQTLATSVWKSWRRRSRAPCARATTSRPRLLL